jgi:hypothetical protein
LSTQITREFNEPFTGGGANSGISPAANIGGSLVAIAGRIYPVDTASNRFNQRSIDVLQQRNTTDNRDVLLLPQNVWRQQVSNWNSGAGQSNMDRDDAIQSRYEASFGIDPWEKWRFSLLNETVQLQATSGATWLTLHEGYLVVVNGNTTYWYEDFGTMTASATIGPDDVIDIADRGDAVMALNDQGYIYRLDDPLGTATQYYNSALTGANFIAWEKDYLLCGHANVLKWVKNNNQTETIYTHPDPSFRWESACEGPQAIYVLGGYGDKWVVHKVTIKDDGTGLNPAIVAAELPDGEIGYKIDSYLGYVFIGTDKGVRMAQPDANGDLTLGAIIPTDAPVQCFEGQDRFMWYGVSSMNPAYSSATSDAANVFPDAPVPGLGRLDLSTFTTTALTPAYANDIAAWDEVATPVTSCVTWLGKRVFAARDAGVFYEGEDKVPGGWLTQGIMSFSVEDLKSSLYMQAKWVPDCSGMLYLDLAFDSSGYSRYASIRVDPDDIRTDNINLYGILFSRVNVRYVMTRCPIDNTKAPILTRWEFRAFPVKGRSSRWEVPVILADDVDINGIVETRNPSEDRERLLSLVQNGAVFQFQESGQSYQVLAREFLWQPERLSTTGNGWQGTLLMVLEEVV